MALDVLNIELAKRLNRLPKEDRSIMLQLLNKFEYVRSRDVLAQHIKNVDNIINPIGARNCNQNINIDSNLINKIASNYLRLPSAKKRYMFINKNTAIKLTLKQLSEKVGKSNKTIYRWIYNKNADLYGKYDVIREII